MKILSRLSCLFLSLWSTAVGHAAELDAALTMRVQEEMSEWGLRGVALALVDGDDLIFARGYGEANRDSIFRVGSISKLFNAIAVMQQVEKGVLDLDAPLPFDLLPLNPFSDEPSITLRQILCHRSGLQREGAVGGYLDVSEPSLADTVASVRSGVLVTRPGERMRYSNLAPSIAGFLLSRSVGQAYESYQHEKVLKPLGMRNSFWRLEDVPADRLIPSHMRVADGKGGWSRRQTPVFNLGTIPAGNLFSTVDDLARFASSLMRGGREILQRQSLAEMWEPQLTDQKRGFGLGFSVGQYRGHRSVGHSGAVFGHSTTLTILPEAQIACIVLVNEDIANGRVRAIANVALDWALFQGRELPLPERRRDYQEVDLSPFVGAFESESYWAELKLEGDRLVGDLSGQPTQFRCVAKDEFLVDNRITASASARFERDEDGNVTGFTVGGQHYRRSSNSVRPLPEEWHGLLGVYGVDYIPIVVSERFGHLYAMTENMVDYRLRPVSRQVWALPPGMYVEEELVFQLDDRGKALRLNFANMIFDRLEPNP